MVLAALENQGMVLFSVGKRSGSEAGFEAAVEVSLVFKAAFEGGF